MNSIRTPWNAVLPVALIVLLGAILRCSIAADESLWLDELHTSWTVSGLFGDVASRAVDGNQPPVFFWLTWISVSLLGESEFSIRAVSILAGICTMGLAAWVTWRWTLSAIATGTVAWLIAFDVEFLFYGTEARPYALIEMLSVAQVYLFWRVGWGSDAKPPSQARLRLAPHWVLAAVSTLLVYTHLTSIWLFVAELVFLIIDWGLRSIINSRSCSDSAGALKAPSVGPLLVSSIVAGVASLPAIVQMSSVYQRRGNWEMVSSIQRIWADTWMPLTFWIAIPAICLWFSFGLRPRFKSNIGVANENQLARTRCKLILAFLWAIVPIAMVVALDFFGIAPVALARYTLVGAVAFPIFAGLTIGCLSSKIGQLGLCFLIILASGVPNPVFESAMVDGELYQLRLEDWRTPIVELNNAEHKTNYPVFLMANVIEDIDAIENDEARFQRYLAFPVNGLYRLNPGDRNLTVCPTLAYSHFTEPQIRLIEQHRGAWLLIRGRPELIAEVTDEIRQKSESMFGPRAEQIIISVLDTPQSPVYLVSIDW